MRATTEAAMPIFVILSRFIDLLRREVISPLAYLIAPRDYLAIEHRALVCQADSRVFRLREFLLLGLMDVGHEVSIFAVLCVLAFGILICHIICCLLAEIQY